MKEKAYEGANKAIKKKSVLAVGILLLLCLIPIFIKSPYVLHILILTLYVVSASMAWSVLCSMTGQFSMGHAAFATLGAYGVVIMQVKYDISPWVGCLLSMVIVGIGAMIIFAPCFCLRGPYFTLATIAISEAIRNLFLNWSYVNKASGMLLPVGENSFKMLRFNSKVPYYFVAVGMLTIISIIVLAIDRSKLGYAFKTIREDEDTAEAVGIRPMRYKIYAVFISVALTVIAGSFYAVYIRFVDPDLMLKNYSVEFVLPAVVGGLDFAVGPLVGFFLVPLSEWLRATFGTTISGIDMVVYAIVLIAVIRIQPKGILGWYQDRQIRMRREKRSLDKRKTTIKLKEEMGRDDAKS